MESVKWSKRRIGFGIFEKGLGPAAGDDDEDDGEVDDDTKGRKEA